jgi:hypothetical protein
MKSAVSAVFIVAFFLTPVLAEDFKTLDGKEYKKVTVSRAEPDGVVVITDSGIVKLYFNELPQEVRDKYHYDQAKAAAFAANEAEKQRTLYESAEAARRNAAQKQNEYWITHPGRIAPSSQGGSLYHKYWIEGRVSQKTKDGLFIQCSGKDRDGYEAATGRVLLRGHPNSYMLAPGDHVEVWGMSVGTFGKYGSVHTYQFSQ